MRYWAKAGGVAVMRSSTICSAETVSRTCYRAWYQCLRLEAVWHRSIFTMVCQYWEDDRVASINSHSSMGDHGGFDRLTP